MSLLSTRILQDRGGTRLSLKRWLPPNLRFVLLYCILFLFAYLRELRARHLLLLPANRVRANTMDEELCAYRVAQNTAE